DDNWAESELRTQKKAAPGRWKLRQRLGTVTLVTSNLLILAASNVLFPAFTDLGFGPCPSPCPRAPGVQKGGTCDNTRPNSNSLFKFFQDTAYQI
ncbi:MAG: hypothetical protein ACK57O_01990, partial [Planctomyces sp.]